MSCADAANLLIGVNAATGAKDGAGSVQAYRALPCGKAELRLSSKLSSAFQQGMNFGVSLEALIELARVEGSEPSQLECDVFRASHYFQAVGDDEFHRFLKKHQGRMGEIIYSEITFSRPYRSVSVLICDDTTRDAKGNDFSYDGEPIALVEFWDRETKGPADGDRDERVRFSFKTILTVGSVLSK